MDKCHRKYKIKAQCHVYMQCQKRKEYLIRHDPYQFCFFSTIMFLFHLTIHPTCILPFTQNFLDDVDSGGRHATRWFQNETGNCLSTSTKSLYENEKNENVTEVVWANSTVLLKWKSPVILFNFFHLFMMMKIPCRVHFNQVLSNFSIKTPTRGWNLPDT